VVVARRLLAVLFLEAHPLVKLEVMVVRVLA
jgi:hypothetical protein